MVQPASHKPDLGEARPPPAAPARLAHTHGRIGSLLTAVFLGRRELKGSCRQALVASSIFTNSLWRHRLHLISRTLLRTWHSQKAAAQRCPVAVASARSEAARPAARRCLGARFRICRSCSAVQCVQRGRCHPATRISDDAVKPPQSQHSRALTTPSWAGFTVPSRRITPPQSSSLSIAADCGQKQRGARCWQLARYFSN